MNTSLNPQFDNTLNELNDVQDIPVALNNTSQVLRMTPIVTPITTLPTPLNVNECQALDIQAMTPPYNLQPMQDHQQVPPHPSSQITDVMDEYSFFYAPCNDFQMYHIICKEISFNFESISQLISNTDENNCVKSNNIFIFYYEQPEIKKIYQVTCEMISHAFLFQFLNKIIYNIQFINCEHQQQEFTKIHQENLKFHLKKDLIHYLSPKNVYEDDYDVHKRFIQDYRTYENMINPNTYVLPNHFQQCNANNFLPFDQSYTSQQYNN
ncbi:hypothetical protein RclHR1_27230001 [Rhizophagus clarus]|uniref:Uncharacterized protein n=1 Tax=Rhizophagus clarus TaxID=94130 RepID=A0A2Z6R2X2_9GLOM|nr:hypothetical protein RclHR1_27230001 [Rhizophagus clarus]GES98108.1 hypothetical protein GLOIN_2v1471944 [Rhizophagus clarus]